MSFQLISEAMAHVDHPRLDCSDEESKNRNKFAISVVGVQSTGKSTILNKLFGTDFKTLQARQIGQTTKGIFLQEIDKLLVMDVEGSDSQERMLRNQGGVLRNESMLEERFALFAFKATDAFIINVKADGVSSHTNLCLNILCAVLQVGLKLGMTKKEIVFFLRDFDEAEHGIETLKARILDQINAIWSVLDKPRRASLSDFINIHVFPFPHIKYCKAEFNEQVNLVRRKFLDSSCVDYIFANKRPIGLDFNYNYTEVWNQVKFCSDLEEFCGRFDYEVRFHAERNRLMDEISAERNARFEAEKESIKLQATLDAERLVRNEFQTKFDDLQEYYNGQFKQLLTDHKNFISELNSSHQKSFGYMQQIAAEHTQKSFGYMQQIAAEHTQQMKNQQDYYQNQLRNANSSCSVF